MTGRSARSTARSNLRRRELIPRRRQRFGVGGGTPPFTKGTTWCLDVLAAHEGSEAQRPREESLDAASTRRRKCGLYCCPTASLDRDRRRRPDGVAQVVHDLGPGCMASRPEPSKMIEFTDAKPAVEDVSAAFCSRFRRRRRCCCRTARCSSATASTARQLHVGITAQSMHVRGERRALTSRCSIPRTARPSRNSRRTTVSRGLHGTATLLPDGRCSSPARTVRRWCGPTIRPFRCMTSWAPDGCCRRAIPIWAFRSARSSPRLICSSTEGSTCATAGRFTDITEGNLTTVAISTSTVARRRRRRLRRSCCCAAITTRTASPPVTVT